MDHELSKLEQKVHRAIEQCERLRQENQGLRQELVLRADDIKRLHEQRDEACQRLEALLARLPE
jgi:regulator of replication initiation timing